MLEFLKAADEVVSTAYYIERDPSPHGLDVPYDLATAIDRLKQAVDKLRAAGGDLL